MYLTGKDKCPEDMPYAPCLVVCSNCKFCISWGHINETDMRVWVDCAATKEGKREDE